MLGDKVKIVKGYCADSAYVGLKGKIIEEFNDPGESRRIKVKISKNDNKYYLGDEVIFPLRCLDIERHF